MWYSMCDRATPACVVLGHRGHTLRHLDARDHIRLGLGLLLGLGLGLGLGLVLGFGLGLGLG